MEELCEPPISSFITKLWTLVDNSLFDEVVRWSKDGHSFCIVNDGTFASEILPKFFKHNKIASFIRQLNLYGFRKVIPLSSERSNQNERTMEFQHPQFRKGGSFLLRNIKRKISSVKRKTIGMYPNDFHRMLNEMQELRNKQSNLDSNFLQLKQEHENVCLELGNLKMKYHEQQQLLTQIFQFILDLMTGTYTEKQNRKKSLPGIAGSSDSNSDDRCFHIPEENEKKTMVLLKDCYAMFEDKYKTLFETTLAIMENESQSLVSCVDQTNGNDGNDPNMSSYDVPMVSFHDEANGGNSLTIELDVTIPFLQEQVVEESFGQELKEISMNQEYDSVLTEDISDIQCNTLMNRDEVNIHCTKGNMVGLKSLLSAKNVSHSIDHANENLGLMENKEEVGHLLEVNVIKDKDVVQYKEKSWPSLLDEEPIFDLGEKLEDSNDLLFDDVKNPSNVLPALVDHDYIALNIVPPEDSANTIENLVPQLYMENIGDCSTFPLIFLDPDANDF